MLNAANNYSDREFSFDAISQYEAINSNNLMDYLNNKIKTVRDLSERKLEDVAVTITFDSPVDFSINKITYRY